MAQQNQTTLPAARLVRTTHNEDGISVFASDAEVPSYAPFGPDKSSFVIFDSRVSVPVNNMDPIPSFAETLPRCPPQGALFCLSDIKPGTAAPVHRTESMDYCCVLSGEIVLRLDGGDEKTVRAGEFIIQQGANHSWINKTQETCRILCVLIGADKIITKDGVALEETVFKNQR